MHAEKIRKSKKSFCHRIKINVHFSLSLGTFVYYWRKFTRELAVLIIWWTSSRYVSHFLTRRSVPLSVFHNVWLCPLNYRQRDLYRNAGRFVIGGMRYEKRRTRYGPFFRPYLRQNYGGQMDGYYPKFEDSHILSVVFLLCQNFFPEIGLLAVLLSVPIFTDLSLISIKF